MLTYSRLPISFIYLICFTLSPPFHNSPRSVLSSRKDLSQADIQTVLNEIHRHGQAISGLDKKLSDLSRAANAIRREKQKHEDIISRCRGILTLARRAPDEILAHIFELCAADGWNRAPLVCAGQFFTSITSYSGSVLMLVLLVS